jgi:hypothetical protein
MPTDDARRLNWSTAAPYGFKPSPEIVAEVEEIERRDGQDAAYARLCEYAEQWKAKRSALRLAGPPAPKPEPKPAERKNPRATYSKIGRELTAIEERIWPTEREHQAALYVICRMAEAHKAWVAISRRELAKAIGCTSGQTAYDVLSKLVDDGILLRREPVKRFDPRLKRRYADEYTFPRFGHDGA